MLDASMFVSATVHARDVELPDGKKHKMHFKEIPYIEFSRYQAGIRSEDQEARAVASVNLIVASLCEADGTPAIAYEDVVRLKPAVATAIFMAAVEVSTPTKKKPSKLAAKSASGTS